MSAAVAESVKGRCRVIAVSNAYTLAPFAEALVSHDGKWWRNNPDAFTFTGRRFCARAGLSGTEYFFCKEMRSEYAIGCNSGLMGMLVARHLGASKIALLGFDMHGDHFFGKHQPPLKNTSDERRKEHLNQFKRFSGCDVVNCTPGSALKLFPSGRIEDLLCPQAN
jgi:hypothetical protein